MGNRVGWKKEREGEKVGGGGRLRGGGCGQECFSRGFRVRDSGVEAAGVGLLWCTDCRRHLSLRSDGLREVPWPACPWLCPAGLTACWMMDPNLGMFLVQESVHNEL